MTADENDLFCCHLRRGRFGPMMAVMAKVQYDGALRISEVAALTHQCVRLELEAPENSRLVVTRKVVFSRAKNFPNEIEVGFKNAEANDGIKELPVMPGAFEALKSIWSPGSDDLLFHDRGEPFSYRQIQHAYNKAMIAAGLPYRSTHVMRHGGCRNIYNKFPDLEVAKQLLGNTSLQSTLVYAKRHKAALTAVAHELWEQHKLQGRGLRLIK